MKRIFVLSCMVGLLLVTSCKEDVLTPITKERRNAPVTVSNNDCLFSFSIDMESTTVTSLVNPNDMSNVSFLDRAAFTPSVERVEIEFCIKEDGTATWLITQKDPTHPLDIPTAVTPSDLPTVKTTYIENNIATFYDENGEVIEESPISLSDMEALKDELLSVAATNTEQLDIVLQDIQNNGGTLEDLENNLVKATVSSADGETVLTYDMNNALLMAIEAYNTQGEMLYQVFCDYDTSSSTPVLKNMYKLFFKKSSSSQVPLKTKVDVVFHQFTITDNS